MIKRGIPQQSQRRHRLPEQSRVPETPDLEYLFSMAAKQPGHLVELPWTQNRQPYVLTAKLERRNNEQSHQWCFYRGDGQNSKLEWTYESSDIVMIHSLIMTSFPPEPIVTDRAMLAQLQPGSDQEQPAEQTQPFEQAPAFEQPAFDQPFDQAMPLPMPMQQSMMPMMPMLQLPPEMPMPQEMPPAPVAPRKGVMGVLEGSLADMPLPSLMTSVQSSRLTGRLSIHSHDETADLFFEEGELVGARRPNQEGEEAFLELSLNSAVGEFKFFDAEKTPNKSINLRAEPLMLKAAALSDQTKFLDRQGLKSESCLMRGNPNITEKEFEGKLANLVPVDMGLQKRMYQAVDNKTNFADLLKKCALNRSQWTPLIFNLLSSGIVHIENKTAVEETSVVAGQDQTDNNPTIDLVALEKFTSSMTRRDTGIYTEIAYLFFLEHEFYRFHSYETPFTIVLFKFGAPQGELPKETMKNALDVVKATVRKADILGHYEGDDYALILPHTLPAAAAGLVQRLHSLLSAPPFRPNEVLLSMGVAGIPEDCQDLMSLLKMARYRKKNPN